ncbi:MAG: hypothetical protein HFF17_09130 [Oscillospiraceae bacterium]|nr:hypothetical protein [Oscillospiraceae bacterium]
MTDRKRAAVRAVLLALGAGMVLVGLAGGEAQAVWGKAVRICLECIGIG